MWLLLPLKHNARARCVVNIYCVVLRAVVSNMRRCEVLAADVGAVVATETLLVRREDNGVLAWPGHVETIVGDRGRGVPVDDKEQTLM